MPPPSGSLVLSKVIFNWPIFTICSVILSFPSPQRNKTFKQGILWISSEEPKMPHLDRRIQEASLWLILLRQLMRMSSAQIRMAWMKSYTNIFSHLLFHWWHFKTTVLWSSNYYTFLCYMCFFLLIMLESFVNFLHILSILPSLFTHLSIFYEIFQK